MKSGDPSRVGPWNETVSRPHGSFERMDVEREMAEESPSREEAIAQLSDIDDAVGTGMDTVRAYMEPIRELTTPQLLALNARVIALNYNRVITDQSLIDRMKPKGIHILDPELEHHFAKEQPVEAHWRCRLYVAVVDSIDPDTVFFDVPKPEFDALPRTRIHKGWVKGFYGGLCRMDLLGDPNGQVNDPNLHGHVVDPLTGRLATEEVDLSDLTNPGKSPLAVADTDDLLSGKLDLADMERRPGMDAFDTIASSGASDWRP